MHRGNRIRPLKRDPFGRNNIRESWPGWVEHAKTSPPRRSIDYICFDCYGAGHFASDDASEARLNLSGFHLAVSNYKALSPDLQKTIPDHNYKLSKMSIERVRT